VKNSTQIGKNGIPVAELIAVRKVRFRLVIPSHSYTFYSPRGKQWYFSY